ncbi:MAG TPA: LacI family DNA-binding transcriptional regulator [Bellilinea sp.]|nr:LacI family DNA-binding transcriptional regulator [Bellilinea sp.]
MTTIKDVAKQAGVSVTSVSYALNKTGTISETTRKRVLEAAEELNYHPNAFAQNLKKPKTRTIGVFISRFGGSFYEEILEGIHQVVLTTNYELIVCPESRPVRKMLTHRQVDGAIVFDSKVNSDLLLRLASEKFPIVVLDRYLESEFLLPLLIDNHQGAVEVFYHLYDQGIRRICFVSGALDSLDNMERMEAFIAEGNKNNINVQCYFGNFTQESGYEIAQQIIDTGDLPDAAFCANDKMAIGFFRALKENGLKVPDDMAIVGFDDIQIAQHVQPSLTTIRVSRLQWGSTAATQLIDLLDYEKPFQCYRIPTQLIVRETSQWAASH